MWLRSMGQEDPLEEEIATHSVILTWKISWTEEPGRLQSKGVTKELDTTEHVYTHTHIHTYTHTHILYYIGCRNLEKKC